MCIARERPQSKQSWQCSHAGHTDHLTCVNINSFQRRWLDCCRTVFTVCGSGFIILMSSEPSSSRWRSIGLLYSDSHICLSVRNWCAQTVTKTVTCQVQNGTTLQRVYQTCRWPQGCNGGRWVYNQHTLTRCLYHFRELPLQPVH